MIKKEKIIDIQNSWAARILSISSNRNNPRLALEFTESLIDEFYGFKEGTVLFKPTKAKEIQFRFKRDETLARSNLPSKEM